MVLYPKTYPSIHPGICRVNPILPTFCVSAELAFYTRMYAGCIPEPIPVLSSEITLMKLPAARFRNANEGSTLPNRNAPTLPA